MRYKKFLYSLNGEKFYWSMLLPKKGIKFAKTKDDIEWRKICVNEKNIWNCWNIIWKYRIETIG